MDREIPVTWDDWRPGDQRVYISDIRKVFQDLNWKPKVNLEIGIKKLYEWISANHELFS